MDDRFAACWPVTLAQECPHPDDWANAANFSNDAHDPGGETMCGITQREYDHYRRRQGLSLRGVRFISRPEGNDIYYTDYWLPNSLKLPPGLDLSYFDAAVNEGPFAANKIVQFVTSTPVDGWWGEKTQAGVDALKDVGHAVQAFTARREAVYRTLSGYPYFGRGWIERAVRIGVASLKMVPTGAAA